MKILESSFTKDHVSSFAGIQKNIYSDHPVCFYSWRIPAKGVVVQVLSHNRLLPPHILHHARPPCSSPSLGACSNSYPLSQWCHPTISFSVILFSSCLQSFPASGSFLISQLFTSGGQNIEAASSVLPVNIQGWFPLGLSDLISFQPKGLSRVFSNTMVQKHQFFVIQPSLWSNCHIHTWLLEKP